MTIPVITEEQLSAAAQLAEARWLGLFTLLMSLGSCLSFASDKSFKKQVILTGLFNAC